MAKKEVEPRRKPVKTAENIEQERRRISIAGTVLVWLGVAMLLGLVVYMIVNIESTDQFATMWIFAMMAGILFTFIGIILSLAARNRY